MKKSYSFRLQSKTENYLTLLAEDEQDTRTGILEKAVAGYYSKKMKRPESPLAKFAGILSEEQGDELLRVIRQSRVNKDIKVF